MIVFFSAKKSLSTDEFLLTCLKKYAYLAKWITSEKNIDCNIENVRIVRDKKPRFENLNLHFSISHSKDYIVSAVSKFQVGIDIERVENKKDSKLYSYLGCKSNEEFYRLWTKIEAYAKYTGEGLSFSKGGFEKNLNRVEQLTTQGILSWELPFFRDYVLTVVSKKQEILLCSV